MAQTLLGREQFNGQSTYTSGSPGSFFNGDSAHSVSAVTGTIYRVPVGEYSSPVTSPGWSGDVRDYATYATWSPTSTPPSCVQWGACFFIKSTASLTSNQVYLLQLWDSSGTNSLAAWCGVGSNGNFWTMTYNGSPVDTGVAFPLNQWFSLYGVWTQGTSTFPITWYMQAPLASLTQLVTATGTSFSSTLNSVRWGQFPVSGTNHIQMRMSDCVLYQLGSTTDKAPPSSTTAPPYGNIYNNSTPQPATWYVNPSTGSDSNTGLSSGSAFQTAQKLSDMLTYSGVFPAPAPSAPTVTSLAIIHNSGNPVAAVTTSSSHGFSTGDQVAIVGATPAWFNGDFTITVTGATTFTYPISAPPPEGLIPQPASGTIVCRKFAYGDTVIVDNSGASLDIGVTPLTINSQGTRMKLTGSPTCTRTLPASWTQYTGHPNIWWTTDSSATDLQDCVVWEVVGSNRIWLNHPSGGSLPVSALDACVNAGGGYWTDGTTLYLVTTDGSNPNTNGRSYVRSRYTAFGSAFLSINGSDISVEGDGTTRFWGSTLIDPSNALEPQYLLQFGPSAAGACRFSNLIAEYGSTHNVGSSASTSGSIMLRNNVTYGPGPYLSASGYFFQDVDFTNSSSLAAYFCYTNCVSTGTFAKIGSSVPQEFDFGGGWWTTHGSGTTPFTAGYFLNCQSTSQYFDQGTVSGSIYISGGVSGGGQFSSPCKVSQSKSIFAPWTSNYSGVTTTVINSIVAPNRQPFNVGAFVYGPLPDSSTTAYYGCTFDLTQIPASSSAFVLFYHQYTAAGLTLTVQDCISKIDPLRPYQLFSNLRSSDTLSINYNCWGPNSSGIICGSYGGSSNKTFSGWQALSLDTNSINVDPVLGPNDGPLRTSPVIGLGSTESATAGLADYLGTFRPGASLNVDAGAIQSTKPTCHFSKLFTGGSL